MKRKNISATDKERFKQLFGFPPPLDTNLNALTRIEGGTVKERIDILTLDIKVAEHNPTYDPENCKLGDKERVSLSDAIYQLYGEEALKLVEKYI